MGCGDCSAVMCVGELSTWWSTHTDCERGRTESGLDSAHQLDAVRVHFFLTLGGGWRNEL